MPRKLALVVLVWLGRSTVRHRIWSVHTVIWQAGTNWAGPVRIQIYYGDRVCHVQNSFLKNSSLKSSMLDSHTQITKQFLI